MFWENKILNLILEFIWLGCLLVDDLLMEFFCEDEMVDFLEFVLFRIFGLFLKIRVDFFFVF